MVDDIQIARNSGPQISSRAPMRLHTNATPIMIDAMRPVHVRTDVTPIMIDAMSREIEAGDILNWRSGGYFGHYMAFGMVTKVDYDKGHIQVINHNKNRVTIWKTHLCVILAKANDYSNIPEEYINLWLTND